MTDAHVTGPERANQMERAFAAALKERPDLYIYGGDNVMNVDANHTWESATKQFGAWKQVVEAYSKRPGHHVIGNHDIWWFKDEAPDNSLRDKGYALKTFGMSNRYEAIEAGGWRFLMLDVFHADGCRVDPEQMEWLLREVKGTSKPVCLVSHAPIFSVSHFEELGPPKNGSWAVPTSWQVGNAVELTRALRDASNVKLALSGHMHHIDRCDYHGITYVCGGAVSGAWWGGAYHGFPPAVVMLELGPDGMERTWPVFWERDSK